MKKTVKLPAKPVPYVLTPAVVKTEAPKVTDSAKARALLELGTALAELKGRVSCLTVPETADVQELAEAAARVGGAIPGILLAAQRVAAVSVRAL